MPFQKELTFIERKAYYSAYKKEMVLLAAGIIELEERNDVVASPGEKAENDAKILDLERKKALVEADRLAFKANREQINPPSKAQLSKLTELIKQVDDLTAENEILVEVVKFTTDGINTWRDIHPGGQTEI